MSRVEERAPATFTNNLTQAADATDAGTTDSHMHQATNVGVHETNYGVRTTNLGIQTTNVAFQTNN